MEFILVYLIAYCKLIWEFPDTISFPLPLQLVHQIHERFYNYYCVLYTHAHISKCLNVHIWVWPLWIGGSVLKMSHSSSFSSHGLTACSTSSIHICMSTCWGPAPHNWCGICRFYLGNHTTESCRFHRIPVLSKRPLSCSSHSGPQALTVCLPLHAPPSSSLHQCSLRYKGLCYKWAG